MRVSASALGQDSSVSASALGQDSGVSASALGQGSSSVSDSALGQQCFYFSSVRSIYTHILNLNKPLSPSSNVDQVTTNSWHANYQTLIRH